MDWNSLWAQNWILVGSAILVLGTLIALLVQSVQTTKATRSQTYQSITSDIHTVNRLIIEHPELYWLLRLEAKSDTTDDIKQRWLISMFLDYYENFWFQHEQRVLTDELWDRWERCMEIDIFKFQAFKKHWKEGELKGHWHKDFEAYVDGRLKEMRKSKRSKFWPF